ncbi:MAG: T9SS type A sorting domain-containing protein [Flavobacteriales bacterium]|nr:T9SS type A sorting domain-containing protein [Flavobacteriales bacterium]
MKLVNKLTLVFIFCLNSLLSFSQWQVVTNGVYPNLLDIDFPSVDTGYICGDHFILKSIDGGNNWNQITIPFNLKSIDFPTNNIGYGCGPNKTIVKTIDGGITWDTLSVPFLSNQNLYFNSITFKDSLTGFIAVGYFYYDFFSMSAYREGYIVKTIDGGSNWQQVYSHPKEFRKIFLIENSNTLYCSGGTWGPEGNENILVKSIDFGQNWTQIGLPTTELIQSIHCIDETNTSFIGGRNFFLSSDSTNTLDMYYADSLNIFEDCILINQNNLYIVGRNFGLYKYSTINQNIEKTQIGSLTNNLLDIEMLSNGVGFIVGSSGIILKNDSLLITGIEKNENPLFSDLFYPNPTSGLINIPLNDYYSQVNVTLSNVIGEILHEFRYKNQNLISIDLSNYPKGIYFISVKIKEQTQILKGIKD